MMRELNAIRWEHNVYFMCTLININWVPLKFTSSSIFNKSNGAFIIYDENWTISAKSQLYLVNRSYGHVERNYQTVSTGTIFVALV